MLSIESFILCFSYNPKDIKIWNLSNKEFKVAILRKSIELQTPHEDSSVKSEK